ncbi:MAG: hypothetical protein COY66_03845 [Candidatus Kerfeldbacteria bacterium CG_4_10_14_0_8_um_filter_42_10]|uniref:Condensin complex subunit 1 C-terminal domain-containing protein n=1 Tax=Candidatus Kerfeldbacteria bacterium CG_4_10_14_0_8_um_filter_42_10 TaxID=2014248 RepID=A0A2M7RIN3_9BACT|nr:MAG: hypothetical protein COY66_03845 [Candidatus Kerfeldbacteria bacterium CG_4_10_14_0_8_um_filter_42_10]
MPIINLKDLESENPKIKYGCTKKAIALSEKNPQALYPMLDDFAKLLDNENRILKWSAIIVVGNLSQADKKNKISKLLPRLFNFLHEKEMITASNSIKALSQIAKYQPKFKEKIFKEFLKVEKAQYYNKGEFSPECRNIVIGQVIKEWNEFRKELNDKKDIVDFIKRQTKNTRPAVKKKAELLLNQI